LINSISSDPQLLALLELILDKPVLPFQTLNFIRGSGQRAHSDSIHMTTYPLGYLVAVWIALEDIHENSGPLFYYPGSHKLPYLLNDDFGNISTGWMLGNREYTDYEDVIANLILKKGLQPERFLPRKGDILVWHANLLHGGEPIVDPELTRKSMVIHYFAHDVIKYHEITERPSLIPEYPILQSQQAKNQT
jgi:ectoine hydroxylase-related dioxygenase (phytanoyl-CoA dioxygenase family)